MVMSLVELCVRSAIDNLSHLGDVGHTDMRLLEVILPHCDADQLLHVETSTKGRDLSPVTDELWRKCYSRKFGNDAVEMVKQRMADRKCKFKWKQLYQAKVKEQEEIQKKGVDRLRELYKEANSLKANRQIQACEITPPDSKRKKSAPGGGGSAPAARFANCKGRLMKKARMEYVNSNEAKMHAAMRRKPVTASNSRQVSIPVPARQPSKIGNTMKK